MEEVILMIMAVLPSTAKEVNRESLNKVPHSKAIQISGEVHQDQVMVRRLGMIASQKEATMIGGCMEEWVQRRRYETISILLGEA